MNRRRFVYSGAAISAFTAQGMTARSYAAILGANDRVQLGVIGTGRRGLIVSNGFVQDSRTQIVSLCDVYGRQLKEFQGKMGAHLSQPSTHVAYEDLLSRRDIDAVLIATPDHLHVQIGSDSLSAGKHVYLEKPTVHQWKDRTRLQAALEKSGKKVQCGTQQRSGEHYQHAKQEFFDSGRLGDVVLVRAVWHNFPWQRRDLPPQPKPPDLDWDRFLGPAPRVPYEHARYTSWRSFREYGGGVLADILTHWVDVAQWMLNDAEPQRASALGGIYTLRQERNNPDTVSAVVQYKSWNLNFESSVLSLRDDHPSVFFEGTHGNLNITREGYTFRPNEGEPVIFESKQDLEVAHTKSFLDAVVNGTAVSAPLRAGLEATLPVQMCLVSYWARKTATPLDLA